MSLPKPARRRPAQSTNAWIVTALLDSNNDPQYVAVIMAADQHHDGIYYKNQLEEIFQATAKYDASKNSSDSSDE